MTEHVFIGLASSIVLGIAAQWMAWSIRIPSIFLLLLVGFGVGPATGFLYPQELLGELLFPAVSLSVAIILFEGGLSLRTVVLLISFLFILLSARLQLEDFALIGWPSVVFLLVLVIIARPAAVALSTIGSDMPWQERAFLAWVAPRGIVAAEVSEPPSTT